MESLSRTHSYPCCICLGSARRAPSPLLEVVIRRRAAIHRPPRGEAACLLRRRWIPARVRITMKVTMRVSSSPNLAAKTMTTTGPERGRKAAGTMCGRERGRAAARGRPAGRRRRLRPGAAREPCAASCTPTATGCSGWPRTREDALRSATLTWRGLPQFEGRSWSARSYKIATNACLAIERRPRRVLPVDYGPPADPHDGPGEPVTEAVAEPYPDERARARQRAWPVRRPVMNSARASSSPSSRHCSTCPRDKHAVLVSATCSASRPAKPPRRSKRRPSRSTAPCSAPARRSTSDCRNEASRRRSAR